MMIYTDKKTRHVYAKRVVLVLMAILLLCTGIWFLCVEMPKLKSGRTTLPPEILRASKEFKAQAGHRAVQAKALLPYLTVGMSKEDACSLLGEPDSQEKLEYHAVMHYVLGRSNMVTVFLGENDEVVLVESGWREYANHIERVWPLLRPGMTKRYIVSWLGGPQEELKDGREWQYQYRDDPVVFTISFDMNDKVVKLEKN